MYVKSISDSYNNIVQLNYENKSLEEYEEPIFNDIDGNIVLSPIFAHHLKTIKIATCVNIQTIEFKYQIQNKTGQLVAFLQLEDTCPEPVLKFSYKNVDNSTQLDQIRLPSGEKFNFIYHINKLEHIGHSFDSYSGEYLFKEQFQVTIGPNYLILSEIYVRTLNFKILQTNKAPLMNLPQISEVCM
ncbi:unnamed protein product [Rotaria sp. Silwood2]|nr:unnamed protein product [Rotaria sp. Silwood2]CAF4617208.1 unnamed protein product [Rotaria sp. Silwood2]